MFLCVNAGRKELIVKKSKFIAISERIASRGAAKEAVSAIRAEYPDATHVCHAFIADERGDDFGYDDDGEPSGTAGAPILSALRSAGACKSIVAVVRYFGGIKLGAAGLVRAYRQGAAELIESVGLSSVEERAVYELECDKKTFAIVSQILRNSLCTIDRIMYNYNVRFTALCPPDFDVSAAVAQFGIAPVKSSENVFIGKEVVSK
ncbi:MAG: YigZ family protein [Roseburia sp.]|nr:YigZ family protein [Roseburia sp.]